MTAALRFNRSGSGYRHRTDTHTYIVTRTPREGGWELRIYAAKTTAGIRTDCFEKPVDASWNSTKGLCVAIASEYNALGNDYRQCDHGSRSRITEATQRAYATDRSRMLAGT